MSLKFNCDTTGEPRAPGRPHLLSQILFRTEAAGERPSSKLEHAFLAHTSDWPTGSLGDGWITLHKLLQTNSGMAIEAQTHFYRRPTPMHTLPSHAYSFSPTVMDASSNHEVIIERQPPPRPIGGATYTSRAHMSHRATSKNLESASERVASACPAPSLSAECKCGLVAPGAFSTSGR
ncbi:hypothetical protein VTO73DRAFT_11563 [Trametes versicolor]